MSESTTNRRKSRAVVETEVLNDNGTSIEENAMSEIETPVFEDAMPEVEETVVEEVKPRMSEVISNNTILSSFAQQFLDALDEIAAYNKEVLAKSNSDWTSAKVLAKARELGEPTDANVKPNDDVKAALGNYSDALTAFNLARRNVIEVTSKVLGISLDVTTERNAETEAPLREKHKFAVAIGTQLQTMADMLQDPNLKTAITEFLVSNPLPQIGRAGERSFGKDEKSTPKYRVTVTATDAEGNVKVNEAGFTKASQAASKFYPRGEGIKPETLRTVWENAGNNGDVTVTSPVEFDDNGLHFVITKK